MDSENWVERQQSVGCLFEIPLQSLDLKTIINFCANDVCPNLWPAVL